MDRDVMKNGIFLIFLCCFFLFVIVYHTVLLYTLNEPREKAAENSGEPETTILFDTHDSDTKNDAAAAIGEKQKAGDEIRPLTEELRAAYQFREKVFPGWKAAGRQYKWLECLPERAGALGHRHG